MYPIKFDKVESEISVVQHALMLLVLEIDRITNR